MSPRRRSLRDRDEFAIAHEADAEPAPEQPSETSEPEPAPAAADAGSRTRSTSQRTGIYFQPAGRFDDAKAAYLADWQSGGQADTFTRWIAGAVEQHAAKTPKERAKSEAQIQPSEHQGAGLTRSFNLPNSTVAAMRAAISADQDAGRWSSLSQFCGLAIAAAIEAARTRAGGTLPPPPPRLPNRLIR